MTAGPHGADLPGRNDVDGASSDTGAVDDGATPSRTSFEAAQASFDLAPADAPLNWPSRLFLVFIAALGIAVAATSSRQWQTLVAFCLAIFPSVFVFAIIVYRLRDPRISKSFLIGQTFITSVPGIILVTTLGTRISLLLLEA